MRNLPAGLPARGAVRFTGALMLALMLWLPAGLLQADSVTVTITVDNGYGFGFGDQNGIYAGQYYGGVDNCTSAQIFGSPCYVFVPPDNPTAPTDTGPEIYNITAGSGDYIYIVAWSDDAAWQGAVASFTDNTTATTVTTSPAWPWQVFATGTNWHPNCGGSGTHGPPLTGFSYAINNQIATANASAGGPGSSVTWVGNTASANGRLDFSGQFNGYTYPYAVPPCIASGATWMEYNPEPANPNCDPFVWGSIPDYASIPNFLREYLIYRIGPLGELTASNTCTSANGCLSLSVPTNIVVYSCGNCVQEFYTPTATDTCCKEALTVTCNPPSGTCFYPGTTNTVTCTASDDGCGNSVSCSFTVTVLCTNCLQVQCPANKTVQCGTAWTFDVPTASSCCTNEIDTGSTTLTNVLITSTGIVTNGACPQVAITQTWLIEDACGDSTNCSQTVTVEGCCTNECCGPDLGAQTIHWLQLPLSGTVNSDPFGSNTNGTWIITNLPCYGNVLVTQNCPSEALWFLNSDMVNVPNSYGSFEDVETGYGPYSWGTGGWLDLVNISPASINYTVNFYFLDGPPNPCTLFLGVTGLGEYTTATVSQVVTFRAEYDLNSPLSDGTSSAYTTLNGIYGPSLIPGVSGTVVGSAYSLDSVGDYLNTGWAVLQPTNNLLTTNLPTGSGTDINGNPYPASGTYPCLSLAVTQEPGDGIGFTVGYTCCTNCLQVQCPTNKTVQCGTAWAFDVPTATTCCTNEIVTPTGLATNVLITSTSIVTNGTCPQYITNTWIIYDACGNTNTCSQTVTVVDTTPPVITCPTNTVVVALNTNCLLVIPAIQFTATDNCTPTSKLVYSQSPPAGTIVSGPSATVTVTVTDLCGNSSQCSVTVEGESKTGPVITCPTSMTVTNCTVPCVPVTATNCACPPSSMTITQSPACGTPIGPGINSVTVTVTDCNGNSSSKVVSLSIGGAESFLGNLYNTGNSSPSDTPASLLADDTVDPHYSLPPAAVPAGMPGDYYGNAVAVSDIHHLTGTSCAWFDTYVSPNVYVYTPWSLPPDPAVSSGAVSKWIAPDYTNNGCCPSGSVPFVYTLTFNLPSVDSTTATLSGRWAADNGAAMYLNSVPVPLADGGVIAAIDGGAGWFAAFGTWTSFTIPAGPNSGFQAGVNTLTFSVTNFELFTALRVEFTNAFANCSTCAPPAVISITPAQSLQAGSTATFHVNAGGTPPLSYQWQFNNNNITDATNSTLQISSIGVSQAGLYSVSITNPCGGVTGSVPLHVTPALPWANASWTVAVPAYPLAATFGPDLNLVESSIATLYGISAGTTEDFGLPGEGGQIVNVMHIGPNPAPSIQIPLIAPSGSSSDHSYTVVMDIYEPDTSLGTPSTLCQSIPCCVSNLTSGGQDGVTLTLDASNNLHITGSAVGVPFDTGPAANLAVDGWNRVALVVDDPQDGVAVNLGLYLNGQRAGSLTVPTPVGLPINWGNGPATLLSRQTNDVSENGEFYVSSIQFHAAALTPQFIAGIGSPDNGPAPVSVTSAGTPPVLSATLSNGAINITWSGNSYVLQETTDLSSGVWADSALSFTETATTGSTATTAVVNPTPSAPCKFYRLVFRP
jgi:hypothetical protein